MKCRECKTEAVPKIQSLRVGCASIGAFDLKGVNTLVCECGKTVSFTAAGRREVDNRVQALVEAAIGRLPIGMFVSRRRALEILAGHPDLQASARRRELVDTFKTGSDVWYYRPSVETLLTTGNGRLNIIAEQAKHAVIARMRGQA